MPRTIPSLVADRSIMGVRVRIEAADERLYRAVMAGLPAWPEAEPMGGAGLEREPGRPTVWLHFRSAARRPGESAGVQGDDVRVSVDGGSMRLEGWGVMGGADAGRRKGWCLVAPEWIDTPDRLATEVVDTVLLFLLTRAGRVPLHAAGIRVGDAAVLLAGPSGSGKSTLTHAAAAIGLAVLSDDTVYLQTRPELRVWGHPRPIHLLPETAAAVGVGTGDGAVERLRGGRRKVAVPVTTSSAPVSRAALCLLERGQAVQLRRIPAGEALSALVDDLEPGFDHFRAELPEVLRAVAAAGAWRLTLSENPAEAVRAILELELPAGSSGR